MNAMQKALHTLHEEHMKKIAHLIAAAGRIQEAEAVCEALNASFDSPGALSPSILVQKDAAAVVRIVAWKCDHSLASLHAAIKHAGLVIEREIPTVDCQNGHETIIYLQGIDTRIVWRGEAVEMKVAA